MSADVPPQAQQYAQTIFRSFERYNENFRRITKRAQNNFERRDWRNSSKDLVERIELYDKSVLRVVAQLELELNHDIHNRDLWRETRKFFGQRLDRYPDGIVLKNLLSIPSVTRRIFETVGTDIELEFITGDIEDHRDPAYWLHTRTFINWGNLSELIAQILTEFPFSVAYRDQSAMAISVAESIEEALAAETDDRDVLRIELIQTRFFQSNRSYIVGRMSGASWEKPLVVAFKNEGDGIDLDATLVSEDDVSMIFGFTRSYVFVDLEPVESVVSFLASLLPDKPIDELYTVLGRLRQGKTERYRSFFRHLRTAKDDFVYAPGDAGLVMLVFTLPSYDLVFKIIRNEFGYPKNVNRRQVMEKYNLVFKHDRAGRLIDTQEFRHLIFPKEKFEPTLLEELLSSTSDTVHIEDERIVIDHLYIERRLRPLNLYINEMSQEHAAAAVIDYGQAIKDLAITNIFPGDLLLKNFGVTRHGRVVFYDYDELCLVTECNFRELPEASDEDEMRGGEWFYVGESDVFPEQFIRFLAMNADLKTEFMAHHADLLTADFWRGIKQMHVSDSAPTLIPYRRR